MVPKGGKKEDKFHAQQPEDVLNYLRATAKGLSSQEAEQRLHLHGFNEVRAEQKISPLNIMLEQFSSPLVWILLIALGISVTLHETADAIIIGTIVILNATLGFAQEYRAERSIEALQRLITFKARVLRDRKEISLDSKYLVPGDVVLLSEGDKVPADCRLLELHSFYTQEAQLTGESQPVTKKLQVLHMDTPLAERKNMVYSGTAVTQGRAMAVVAHTGMRTEVGRIATLIQEAQEKQTPLQKKLRLLGKRLSIAVIAVAAVVFISGILAGQPASAILLTAIALAVAAIPEGLPAVITISLALGVQRMVRRNALVRKLPSVETLGSVDVICTDKTGTLTHNQMTVACLYANGEVYSVSGSGYEPKGAFTIGKKLANPEPLAPLLLCGTLCNNARLEEEKGEKQWSVQGDPTEGALIVSAAKAGFTGEELGRQFPRLEELPFTSERKMMSTFHKVAGRAAGSKDTAGREWTKAKTISCTKGSPEVVLEHCDRIWLNGKVQRLGRQEHREILAQNEAFAKEALRVLAFAYKDNPSRQDAEKGMIFLGLQAMIDPPREEIKEAINRCHEAGIRVIMITGDQIPTAQAIAGKLGIRGKAVNSSELDNISLEKEIESIGVFARVNPEHKLRIVKALKAAGHVVAMTGDGVNDAPALKNADIGISMGITGTDVAKEASDMILTDDNFTSIVNAVEEGRGIFDNVRKFVNYLLSSNLGEIAVILLASLLRLPLPLTAIQILWVNLITDGMPATALSLDPAADNTMKRPPRPAGESILSPEVTRSVLLFGMVIGLAGLALFWLYQGSGLLKAQSMVFTFLVLFELVRLQVIRHSYGLGLLGNRWLLGAVILSLLLQAAVLYTPLSAWFGVKPLGVLDWGILLLACLLALLAYAALKFILSFILPGNAGRGVGTGSTRAGIDIKPGSELKKDGGGGQ